MNHRKLLWSYHCFCFYQNFELPFTRQYKLPVTATKGTLVIWLFLSLPKFQITFYQTNSCVNELWKCSITVLILKHSMLENIAFLPTKREKITRLSTLQVGEGESLLAVPTFLSGIKECHTTCCNRVLERQGVYRLARTRNAHCKQRKQKKMDRNPPNKILEVTFWSPLFPEAQA